MTVKAGATHTADPEISPEAADIARRRSQKLQAAAAKAHEEARPASDSVLGTPRQRVRDEPALPGKTTSAEVRATTLRLDPELQRGLEMLREITKVPMNRLVNEAVDAYVKKRSPEVATGLGGMLSKLEAYRQKDPEFDLAIRQVADAEVGVIGTDPAEGQAHTLDVPVAGPTHRMVRGLLSQS